MLYIQEAYRPKELFLGLDFKAIKEEIIKGFRKFRYDNFINCDNLLALKKGPRILKISSIGGVEVLSHDSNTYFNSEVEVNLIEEAFRKVIPEFEITEVNQVPTSNTVMPLVVKGVNKFAIYSKRMNPEICFESISDERLTAIEDTGREVRARRGKDTK